MAESFHVSIAVPLFNEESVLRELVRRSCDTLDNLPGGPHELVLVDDGSTDRTFELASEAATGDSRITTIKLSRNFGQQAAYCAALQHTTGDAVVMMDGDLQDAPENIPDLLKKFHEGYDVVYAIRTQRKEGLILLFCYWLFYVLIRLVSRTPLPRDSGDFSIVSRRVVDLLNSAPERGRYLRGLRTWYGFRQVGIPIERHERHSGTPKYNMRSLFRLAFDGIFSFSNIPLRLATWLGAISILFAIGLTGFAVYAKFFLQGTLDIPAGFTATIVAVAFFAGVQLCFLGIIGEYIGRMYEEVKGRPMYVIDTVVRDTEWNENTPNNTASSTTITGGGVVESE